MGQSIYFIGINESILLDLARSLHQQGCLIASNAAVATSSLQADLGQSDWLPKEFGWSPNKLTKDIDLVIIGSEVLADNQELQAALQLKLPIYAYSQYIYQYAQDKQRIVITGGLETDSILAVSMHVLRYWHRAFDYIVHSPIGGWESTVKLTKAPILLLQAHALPTSCLDPTPQFLTYQPHIVLLSGMSEERGHAHATVNDYVGALKKLVDASPKGGVIIYNKSVQLLRDLSIKPRGDVKITAYQGIPYYYQEEQAYLLTPQGDIPVIDIDDPTSHAVAGAQLLLQQLCIDQDKFYEAIPSFSMN